MTTYFFSGKILAAYIFISLIFVVLLLKRTEYRHRRLEFLFTVIFIVYLYFVIKITQFPIFQTENMKAVLGGSIYSSINIVPFKDIFSLASLYNVILTLPVGIIVPILKRKAMDLRSTILMALLPGLLIESAQLIQLMVIGYTLRVIDINDIICNTAGVLAGYMIFCAFTIIINKMPKFPFKEFFIKNK